MRPSRKFVCLWLFVVTLTALAGCRREGPPVTATAIVPEPPRSEVVSPQPVAVGDDDDDDHGSDGKLRWLPEDEHARLLAIEEQLGGFSRTMTEVGYRFNELYFAGLDENWEYADYQLEHIEEAVEAGIIRRPKRAPSSQGFLKRDIPAMKRAIDGKNREAFLASFEEFRQSCNTCHAMERVPFISVVTPEVRLSPVKR
jgi:hypothetical protein